MHQHRRQEKNPGSDHAVAKPTGPSPSEYPTTVKHRKRFVIEGLEGVYRRPMAAAYACVAAFYIPDFTPNHDNINQRLAKAENGKGIYGDVVLFAAYDQERRKRLAYPVALRFYQVRMPRELEDGFEKGDFKSRQSAGHYLDNLALFSGPVGGAVYREGARAALQSGYFNDLRDDLRKSGGRFQGADLIDVANPEDFYFKVLLRFAKNPPSYSVFLQELSIFRSWVSRVYLTGKNRFSNDESSWWKIELQEKRDTRHQRTLVHWDNREDRRGMRHRANLDEQSALDLLRARRDRERDLIHEDLPLEELSGTQVFRRRDRRRIS